MEQHKDNTQLDNSYYSGNMAEFSLQQNQQNLASGPGAGEICAAEEMGSIGGKFEEDEHDEEESKYQNEVQQSEKQMKVGEVIGIGIVHDGGAFNDVEVDVDGNGVVDCDGDDDDDDDDDGDGDRDRNDHGEVGEMLQQDIDMDHEEVAIIKNDGDFSTTSNATSTTGGDEETSVSVSASAPIIPRDNIVVPLLPMEMANYLQVAENNSPTSNEESSMATNSSGENATKPVQQLYDGGDLMTEESIEVTMTMGGKVDDHAFTSSSLSPSAQDYGQHDFNVYEENKENTDPKFVADVASAFNPLELVSNNSYVEEEERPTSGAGVEIHSNLNPEAKEFVPIPVNASSSSTPMKKDFLHFGDNDKSEFMNGTNISSSSSVAFDVANAIGFTNTVANKECIGDTASTPTHPTHPSNFQSCVMLGDEILAQSPRRGERFVNMNEISLPPESEFHLEADQRPHDISCYDNANDNDVDDIKNNRVDNDTKKSLYQRDPSLVQLVMDHGPETSVDTDMDSQCAMKETTMYVESDEAKQVHESENEHERPIEELLNTIQPLPTEFESLNSSFSVENVQPNTMEDQNKELLNIDEKDVISHSPSTEDIQMQSQNGLHASSCKDIPSIPIDMDNAERMQTSMYIEETSTEAIISQNITTDNVSQFDESLLIDTTNPLINDETIIEKSVNDETITSTTMTPRVLLFNEFADNKTDDELVTPSPHSTEEKHLMEDTKENLKNGFANAKPEPQLELKGNDSHAKHHDELLLPVENVAKMATIISDDEIVSLAENNAGTGSGSGSMSSNAEQQEGIHVEGSPMFTMMPTNYQDFNNDDDGSQSNDLAIGNVAKIENGETVVKPQMELETKTKAETKETAAAAAAVAVVGNKDDAAAAVVAVNVAEKKKPKEEEMQKQEAKKLTSVNTVGGIVGDDVAPMATKDDAVVGGGSSGDGGGGHVSMSDVAAAALSIAATTALAATVTVGLPDKKLIDNKSITSTAAKSKATVEAKRFTEKKSSSVASKTSVATIKSRTGLTSTTGGRMERKLAGVGVTKTTPTPTSTSTSLQPSSTTTTLLSKRSSSATTQQQQQQSTLKSSLSLGSRVSSTGGKTAAAAGNQTKNAASSSLSSRPISSSSINNTRRAAGATTTTATTTAASSASALSSLSSTVQQGSSVKPPPRSVTSSASATLAAKGAGVGIAGATVKSKPHPLPRATLTSQMRKIGGGSGAGSGNNTAATKNSVKASTAANAIGKVASNTTTATTATTTTTNNNNATTINTNTNTTIASLINRAKPTAPNNSSSSSSSIMATTAATSAPSKTFTARPAPKTTAAGSVVSSVVSKRSSSIVGGGANDQAAGGAAAAAAAAKPNNIHARKGLNVSGGKMVSPGVAKATAATKVATLAKNKAKDVSKATVKATNIIPAANITTTATTTAAAAAAAIGADIVVPQGENNDNMMMGPTATNDIDPDATAKGGEEQLHRIINDDKSESSASMANGAILSESFEHGNSIANEMVNQHERNGSIEQAEIALADGAAA